MRECPRRRRIGFDIVLGLFLGMMALVSTYHNAMGMDRPPLMGREAGEPGPAVAAADVGVGTLLLIAVAALAVMTRRVWPRASLAVAAAAAFGYFALGNSPGPVLVILAVVLLAVVMALPPAQYLAWAGGLAVALLGGLLVGAGGTLGPTTGGDLVRGLLFVGLPSLVGVMVRGRREAARHERAEELRRHRYEERLRIAREVHDVVGHSLSVINMQAGVALHVLDKRPEQAAPALEVIRRTSKDALTELRGTLAVFRDADADAGAESDRAGQERAPLPGLARLGDLTGAVTAEGREVTVETEGTAVELPTAVDHAAYRIVQEALTNAVRHAGPAAVRVRLGYHPDQLVVEVTDDGRGTGEAVPPEEGSGLAGMRERARAVGGTLLAGPRPEGGFEVRAVLPLGGD